MREKDRLFKTFSYIILGIFAFVCFYPLMLVIGVSFSSEADVLRYGYSIIPRNLSLNTYHYIFLNSGDKIYKSYMVTIFVTGVGTLFSLAVTSMMGFALSIRKLKFRNVISYLCNFSIVFSAGLIPWYIMCVNVYHLKDNVLALILPSALSVWYLFLLRSYFFAVPNSFYESARIDGAGYFRIYASIAIPLTKTGMLTIGLMYALMYWNDWWNALMLVSDYKLFPLQFYLYTILSNITAISSGKIPPSAKSGVTLPTETVKMAVTLLTIGPIVLLYPFVQKYFVQGIMQGGVKE